MSIFKTGDELEQNKYGYMLSPGHATGLNHSLFGMDLGFGDGQGYSLNIPNISMDGVNNWANTNFGITDAKGNTSGGLGNLVDTMSRVKASDAASDAAKEQNRIARDTLKYNKDAGIKAFDSNAEQYNNQMRGLNALRGTIHKQRTEAGDIGLSSAPTQGTLLKKWNE
jgi:hypothetical protein